MCRSRSETGPMRHSDPQEMFSPEQRSSFFLKHNFGQICATPRLTMASVFVGQFRYSVCNLVIVEITGP